ncbi:MAG: hypothetical protein O2909_10155 [Chloroflexi bacterium]|nr:hypothetical protein [Chloroflexota bacterium]MDA1219790.1 hypothetical protein [Chloroflexota bacterium]PKB57282.1 MAG: hypothetical protein BZY73_04050 [SAR202 cluster bacterium Casp-Chloro-G3]
MPERYQEEIEDILRGMGEKTRTGASRGSEKPADDAPVVSREAQPPAPISNKTSFWPMVSPGKLAVIGLVLLLIGAFWVRPLIWVGLGFLVGAYLLFFVKPRSIPMEKRWRGQAIEQEVTYWDRFRRWFKM